MACRGLTVSLPWEACGVAPGLGGRHARVGHRTRARVSRNKAMHPEPWRRLLGWARIDPWTVRNLVGVALAMARRGPTGAPPVGAGGAVRVWAAPCAGWPSGAGGFRATRPCTPSRGGVCGAGRDQPMDREKLVGVALAMAAGRGPTGCTAVGSVRRSPGFGRRRARVGDRRGAGISRNKAMHPEPRRRLRGWARSTHGP